MKFAVLEMKLVLAKVLLNFDVRSSKNTCSSLTYIEGTERKPKENINVIIQKRED